MTPSSPLHVTCGGCGRSNRPGAMFCIGCAGRLPTFVATGPSALETSRAQRLRSASPNTERCARPCAPRGDAPVLASTGAAVVGDDDRVHGVVRVHHPPSHRFLAGGPSAVPAAARRDRGRRPRRRPRPPVFRPHHLPRLRRLPLRLKSPAPRAATRRWKRWRSSIAPSPPPTARPPLRSSFRPSEDGGRFRRRRSRASMDPSGNRSPFAPSAQSMTTSSRQSTDTGQRGPRAKASRSSKPNPCASRRSFGASAPIADAGHYLWCDKPCLHRPSQDSCDGTRSCWPSPGLWCCWSCCSTGTGFALRWSATSPRRPSANSGSRTCTCASASRPPSACGTSTSAMRPGRSTRRWPGSRSWSFRCRCATCRRRSSSRGSR